MDTLEYTNQNSLTRYPFKDGADLTWAAATVASGTLPNTIFTDAKISVLPSTCTFLSIHYTRDANPNLDTWTIDFSGISFPVNALVLGSQILTTIDITIRVEIDVAALSTYFRATFAASDILTLVNPPIFCASTCVLRTPIVTSVTLNNTRLEGTTAVTETIQTATDNVSFAEGTNVQLSAGNKGMTMDVIAGAGQGLYDACEDFQGIVYTLNNITANAFSNFALTNDQCISIQKQTTPSTIYPDGVLTLQATDTNYYTVTLTTLNSITALSVGQTSVQAPDNPITSITLLSTNGRYYTISLIVDGTGTIALSVGQTAIAPVAPFYSGLTLQSSNSFYYPVTLTTTNGVTALAVDQAATFPGWSIAGLQLSNLCKPQCTAAELAAFAYYLNRVKDAMLQLADYLIQVKADYDQLCIQYSRQINELTQIQPAYLQVEDTVTSNRRNDFHRLSCGVYSPTNNELPVSVNVIAGPMFSLVPGTSFVVEDGVKQVLPDNYTNVSATGYTGTIGYTGCTGYVGYAGATQSDTSGPTGYYNSGIRFGFNNRAIKCNNVLYYGFVLSNARPSADTDIHNNGDQKYDVGLCLSTPFTYSYYSLPLFQRTPNYTVAYTCINRQGVRHITLTINLLYNQNVTLLTSLIFNVPHDFTITSGQLINNKSVVTPVTESGFRGVLIDYGHDATCTVSFTCNPTSSAYIDRCKSYYNFGIGLATPIAFANKTVRVYV